MIPQKGKANFPVLHFTDAQIGIEQQEGCDTTLGPIQRPAKDSFCVVISKKETPIAFW